MIIVKNNTEDVSIALWNPNEPLLETIKSKLFEKGIEGTVLLFSKKEINFLYNKIEKYLFRTKKDEHLLHNIKGTVDLLLIPLLQEYARSWDENAFVYTKIIQYKKKECLAILFTSVPEKDDWDPDWDD